MDLIAIKTRIKANLKIKDLVKKPLPAETYKKLFHNNVAQIHNSILCKNLTTACVDWIDLLALQTHISIKKSRPDWSHGYLIYHLINDYIKKNGSKTIHYFETGSAKGFSVLVAAKAIIDNKVTPSLTTVDIIDHHKKRYWNSIKDESGRKSRKELLRLLNKAV